MAAYYGKTILGSLSDAQALPNATAADSTNMVYVGKQTNGAVWVAVYANTAITIATDKAFSIELQSYSADTAASAISPFSKDNDGGNVVASGATSEPDAHLYLLHKTSADGELAFSAGDLICEIGISGRMLDAIGHNYVQLVYTTDANESSEKVDAFVYLKV